MPKMNQDLANCLLKKAVIKARELGVNVCIAITDNGGHLYSFQRMDNAFLGSVDVSIQKAKTSSLFPIPTGDFGALVRNEQLTGMELSNQGLIGFAGGLPIIYGEQQYGAIGISGASAEEDAAIAEYAVIEVRS